MMVLPLCILGLIVGYLVYGRFVEKLILPYREPTPAVSVNDGMDYVPMSKGRNHLIQLLNIAGTGPIFGALMGAKWGPIVLIWIVGGTIFGGAVHDFMCGMMSERNEGKSITILINRYLGDKARYPVLILMIVVMVMVSATFARSASDLLYGITGIPAPVWVAIILVYFMLSTLLPIDKVIGRMYPVFGILLLVMAFTVMVGLLVGGFVFPEFTLANLHPSGDEYFPDMFITVACGAISGFHATQSPMVSRCLKDERDGRSVFYGAMVLESVIAVLWATAGLAFYSDTSALAGALSSGGASGVVYEISEGVAGTAGGVLAVIGVIVCPITSGDTALRAARMMIQDDRGIEVTDKKAGFTIALVLLIPIIILCSLDFTVLWNYFSWLNQTLACVMLWTATVFLLRTSSVRRGYLVTAIPAVFMTMIVTSYILGSRLGFGLDHVTSLVIGAVITVIVLILFVRHYVPGAVSHEAA